MEVTSGTSSGTPRGGIRHLESYAQAKLIDYSGLSGAFARKEITPTDFDFVVEQNNRFLIGEFKKTGVLVSTGQRLTLERLVETNEGRVDVFVAGHSAGPGEVISAHTCVVQGVIFYSLGQARSVAVTSGTTVLQFCQQWSRVAEPQNTQDLFVAKFGFKP
jgi:hypothetical protein